MHNCQVDIEHVKDELALLSRSLTDVLEVHAYFESVELALE